jgi:uncharacterized protein (AIM24 family)
MDHRLIGTTMPVLEFVLEPGESIQAQSGELSWKSQTIQMRTGAQMGGAQGFGGLARRVAGGGSLFMTEYFAETERGLLAFATRVPGQILPVDLDGGNSYLVHRSGFVCGMPGVEVSVGLQRSIGAGLFGGTGFVLQRLGGSGKAWVELDGEVVTYELDPGEVLQVHPGHVGLFEASVSVGLMRIPGIRNMLFGGDGLVLVTLTGPGKVWLQSMPLPQLAGALAPYLSGAGRDTPGANPLERAVADPVGTLGAAAIGVGISAMTGGGSDQPARNGLLDHLAQANPVTPTGEDRAFLPNGGSSVASAWGAPDAALGLAGAGGPQVDPGDVAGAVSNLLGTADASGVDLSGLAGAGGPDVSGMADSASGALSSASDAATGGGGLFGSLADAVGGLLSNLDSNQQ